MPNTLRNSNTLVQREDPASSTSQLYRHTFFSTESAVARKVLVPSLILPLIYNANLLWTCLSLFFGSLLKNGDVSRISIAALNLDDGRFGEALIKGIERSFEGVGSHLRWIFDDRSTGHGDDWSRDLFLAEKTWAVLQISTNASSRL